MKSQVTSFILSVSLNFQWIDAAPTTPLSISLHFAFSITHTRTVLADAAAHGNRRTRRGAMFVHPTEGMCVCVITGRYWWWALRPWRPLLTHEYLAMAADSDWLLWVKRPCLCFLPAHPKTYNSSLSSCIWEQQTWFKKTHRNTNTSIDVIVYIDLF